MPIDDILSMKLKKLETASGPEWRVWERKNLNLHRAVLEWTPVVAPKGYAAVSEAVRSEVARCMKVSWWRGMGFGAVIYLDAPPEGTLACVDDIDGRENRRGTWQWTILVLRQSRAAIGVHMWMTGYLSGIYQQILSRFEAEGYRTAVTTKDKDRLMKLLTMFHPLPEHTDE